MGNDTSISWTDSTWNPIMGCSRVSEGCRNCYAERQAFRFAGPGLPFEGLVKLTKPPRWTGKVRSASDETLWKPFRWRKRRRIFVNSMSDLFHDELSDYQIDRVVAIMIICCDHERRGGHTFQTLTKRSERMRSYLNDPKTLERVASRIGSMMEDGGAWYDQTCAREGGLNDPRIWWGVSVENQDEDKRIADLLATKAAVRFLSCEPLIGPLDLHAIQIPDERAGLRFSALTRQHDDRFGSSDTTIDWVIAGCESGPGARPCSVEWLRSLRDQCAAAGVPFFLKQARERPPVKGVCTSDGPITIGIGSKNKGGGVIELPYLDGVQYAQFPEAP